MAERRLNPNGAPVAIDGVVLTTLGLSGTVTVSRPRPDLPAQRGARRATGALETALENEGVRTPFTVAIKDAAEPQPSAKGTRSTAGGKPAIKLEVPAPKGRGQMVLAIDESGVATWNFPVDTENRLDRTRGGGAGVNTYVIPRAVPPGADAPGTRGIGGALAKKILKVLVFPIVDPIMGEIGGGFVRTWEETKRPYRVRMFGPDDYGNPAPAPMTDAGWASLASGTGTGDGDARALLFLHGTFSRAHAGFGGFTREHMAALAHRYGGRMFAFDHFTLSDDPIQNAKELIARIPAGTALDLDIVSHSRGGLVARVLAEKQAELDLGGRAPRVGKVVFTAAPNGGTPLADPEHLGTYIDTVTNLLQFLPDNGVTEALETVITVAKHAATATANRLEGLLAMRPGGDFLAALNAGPRGDAAYFALAANYEPAAAGLKRFVQDRFLDAIIGAHNDLVVPTGGVYEHNASGYFPIADRHVFDDTAGVWHSGYFRDATAATKIVEWLRA